MRTIESYRNRVQSTEYRVQRRGFTPLETISRKKIIQLSLTGFTLVELMVTVSILAVGIVMVLRSFLSISAALDSGSNRIMAMQLLEDKMNALEQKAKEDAGVLLETKEEQARISNRDAILKLEVVHLSTPEFGIEEQEQDKDKINEVKLMLLWKETNIDKDSILITYLKNQEI